MFDLLDERIRANVVPNCNYSLLHQTFIFKAFVFSKFQREEMIFEAQFKFRFLSLGLTD